MENRNATSHKIHQHIPVVTSSQLQNCGRLMISVKTTFLKIHQPHHHITRLHQKVHRTSRSTSDLLYTRICFLLSFLKGDCTTFCIREINCIKKRIYYVTSQKNRIHNSLFRLFFQQTFPSDLALPMFGDTCHSSIYSGD